MKKYLSYLIIVAVSMIALVGCNEIENPQLENTDTDLEVRKEVTEGDFIYRLISEKAEYIEKGPVNMYAELEYIGDKEEIDIYHAASPFFYPMVETTRDFKIEYAMNQPLLTTTLIKGVPLRGDYVGAGGYSSEDGEEFINFMKQIVNNEFPSGEYEVNGSAVFYVITNVETDEKIEYNIEAQIEFRVTK